jgi:hypothetical protein
MAQQPLFTYPGGGYPGYPMQPLPPMPHLQPAHPYYGYGPGYDRRYSSIPLYDPNGDQAAASAAAEAAKIKAEAEQKEAEEKKTEDENKAAEEKKAAKQKAEAERREAELRGYANAVANMGTRPQRIVAPKRTYSKWWWLVALLLAITGGALAMGITALKAKAHDHGAVPVGEFYIFSFKSTSL